MSAIDVAGAASAVLVGLFAVLFLLAFAIFIVGVSNRSDADPKGARPMAAYLFSAAFLFLWVAYGGVVVALDSLVNLIGNHPSSFFAPPPSYGNEAIRDCVLGAILVVFAGGAYLLHTRRGNLLADAEADPSGPTKRLMRSFVAFVSFVAVLVFVVSLIAAVYGVFELISPTIFGGAGGRDAVTRGILDALVLVLASSAIFAYHQRFAPPGLRLLSARTPSSSTGPGAMPPAPPTSAAPVA
jgi:uncharacterized RDD family membrane protein YckC